MSDSAERIESIFAAAVALPVDQRGNYLDAECANSPPLRQQIDALLRAHDKANHLLDRPAAGLNQTGVHTSQIQHPGELIAGRYKLLEAIGEGGMGSVWVAEQKSPVKRKVAVKLIKAGMDSKSVLARFEAERQALAMMDHPNIAKVFDGGMTDQGRPYFVMEYVKGVPLTEYCDHARLSLKERLNLFIPVCQAVQHAHQKGIIHRDLKPSNILICLYDGKPVPKVIDFGLAKAMHHSLTEQSLHTAHGMMVGTPLYMSPEQAEHNNLDVDTRTDIYSLGVILYELLTGTTPLEQKQLREAAYNEILRLIKEVEPPKPSTRLSGSASLPSIAAQRSIDPKQLSKSLTGDLDWIVMKSLDKERSRRYETANGLARDVERFLNDEAVEACPPSAVYRLRKTWQRNKFAFGAISAIALSLVIGIATSSWQAFRANWEAARADAEAAHVIVALNELRETAPAFAEQARALAAKEKFAEAIEKLDYAAKLQPNEADYLIAKGNLLQTLFRFADAAKVYADALQKRPGDSRAEGNLKVSKAMAEAPRAADGQLAREDLGKLLSAMQNDHRPAAELMPVSRLLGEEKKLLLDYWLQRLKDLPVSADQPLAKRLTVSEDGRLRLDLEGSKIFDLSPLAGAPLVSLGLANAKELIDIAPLRGMSLESLNLAGTKVLDLSPLMGMASLERLVINSTPVTDLEPLRGIPLRVLDLAGSSVADLSPLRGAPLEELELGHTRVSDLTPLVGMPLKLIDLTRTPVVDFTPLSGLPLEICYLQYNRISDLGVLRNLPLRELSLWHCVDARNYAALSEIKSLELLLLPAEYFTLPGEDLEAIGRLRTHPKLRQLGAEIMNNMGFASTGPKELFWREWDRCETLLAAVRNSEFTFVTQKLPDGTYRINVENQPLSDLSLLSDTPISELWLNGCKVSDLSPLRGLKLKKLGLWGNPVEDLRPLIGMPLDDLTLEATNVTDLTPLKGMPLTRLWLGGCDKLKDISPLAEMASLEILTLPVDVRNVEQLRNHPSLKLLSYSRESQWPFYPTTTTDQFWEAYGKLGWIRAMRERGISPRRLNQLGDRTWELSLNQSDVKDISFLQGANISHLEIGETQIADLGPLRGMPLTFLHMYHTKVTDLSPLKGMRLTHLNIVANQVSDISVLRDMPLTSARLHECDEITDLAPLREVKTLKTLTIPRKSKDYDFLRDFPSIERISFNEDPAQGFQVSKTAAEFWQRFEQLRSKDPAVKPPMPTAILSIADARTLKDDRSVAIRIVVNATGQSDDGNWYYLNTEADFRHPDNFTIAIRDPVPDRLRELGLPLNHTEMKEKTLVATGKMSRHRGRLQLVVSDEDWIWIEEPSK